MRHIRPTHLEYRPQAVATAEIERSRAVTEGLLAGPSDWMRRVLAARFDVRVGPPAADFADAACRGLLEEQGFKQLCTARVRQPTPMGRMECCVDVWVDPTTTIRAEIFAENSVMFSTLFDDGSALLSVPDELAAEWLRSQHCDVLCGSRDVASDLARFQSRLCGREADGRLLCANPTAYVSHLRLATLRLSRAPRSPRCRDGQFAYPMTPMLAVAAVAGRSQTGVWGVSRRLLT